MKGGEKETLIFTGKCHLQVKVDRKHVGLLLNVGNNAYHDLSLGGNRVDLTQY